jgi:putative SOS response-associated peptidase YedK
MCGRYSITTNPEAMRRLFQFLNATPNVRPRYNAAPTDELPVVRLDKEGNRELAMLRWGLIPSWAEDPKIGYSTINARAETVATKPAFREAFRKRRCLVPADGFYEWENTRDGKQPYRITLKDGEPFAMAGLWEWWRRGEQRIESFTIIVTTANELSRRIHDRMPVILHPDTWDAWLTAKDAETPTVLLQPYPASQMTIYPVSKRVGNVKNDDPELILPLVA